jgi:hypothetical protein
MRNTLITIAAWTAAIAIVLWQRLLWPGLKNFFPGIEDFFSPVRTNAVQPEPEPAPLPVAEPDTFVIERSKPGRSRRRSATGFAA